jgi:signal transduction histidine kinase
MLNRIQKSLFIKSMVFVLGISVLFSIIIVIWYSNQINIKANEQIIVQRDEIVASLKESLQPPLRFHNVKDIGRVLSAYSGRSLEWVVIFDSLGVPIYTVGNLPDISIINKNNHNDKTDLTIENNILKNDIEIQDGQEKLGNISFGLKVNTFQEYKLKEKHKLLVITVIAFLVMTLILGFFTQYLIRRINKLRSKILNFNPNQNTPLNDLNQGDELDNIFSVFSKTAIELQKAQTQLVEKGKAEAMSNLATQVSHDIRSPLAALNMVIKDISDIDEDKRVMIRGSVNRIQDIANELLAKHREIKNNESNSTSRGEEKYNIQLISSLLNSIISEKRMQYRSKLSIELEFIPLKNSYGLFANIQSHNFKRVISNIINNAVEAMGDSGKVHIELSGIGQSVEIKITDNGSGIPPEILKKLGTHGETYGKSQGNGLGLYHAKKMVESWGGTLNIESELNIGTTLIIQIPKAQAPSWFVELLQFKSGDNIIILDDDSTIHQIWDKRFKEAYLSDSGINVFHFSTANDVTNWVSNNKATNSSIFLFDFELLGQKITGLDLIEKLNIAKETILVTSRYEENSILERTRAMGLKMIPKSMAELVPIEILNISLSFNSQTKEKNNNQMDMLSKYDAVYLDDDKLIRWGWESTSRKKGIKLLSVGSPGELNGYLHEINKSTPIYIDRELGKEFPKGEVVAKSLFEQGFQNLYLATGYDKDYFPKMDWIKDVIGKEAPWEET